MYLILRYYHTVHCNMIVDDNVEPNLCTLNHLIPRMSQNIEIDRG